MTKIPHPDKPCEADEIIQHIAALHQCKSKGVWDLEGVMRWLKVNLPQMDEAAERMAEYIDEQYPDTAVELVKREEEAA